MAQISYRANLAVKSFPLLPSAQGNTVIVSGQDQAYSRYGTPGERERDVNTPQAFYMQNFLPTIEGYISVGYLQENTIFSGPNFANFVDDSPYRVRIADLTPYQYIEAFALGNTYSIIESATGLFYYSGGIGSILYSLAGGRKISVGVFQRDGLTSYATSGGNTYGFFNNALNAGANTYNRWDGTDWIDAVPLGLTLSTVRGIVASSGYVIAYSGSSVAWCSTTNPVDFVPSLITGAGGASIQEVKGNIRFGAPTAYGFILYTDNNCISATYTGNSRFPFKFTEIKGAGGFISQRLIVFSDNLGYQIAITKAGLQKLGTATSESFLPELSDFIFARYTEEWNYITNTFIANTHTKDDKAPIGRLALIDSRWLCYSYPSIPATSFWARLVYDYILVYDLELQRWGKLKRDHVQVYSKHLAGPSIQAYSKVQTSIAILGKYGETTHLILGGSEALSDNTTIIPMMALGKYKYVRSRHIALDSVRTSGFIGPTSISDAFASVSIIPTNEDGTLGAFTAGYLTSANTQKQNINYNFSVDAFSHTLILKGYWTLTDLALNFHIGGKL